MLWSEYKSLLLFGKSVTHSKSLWENATMIIIQLCVSQTEMTSSLGCSQDATEFVEQFFWPAIRAPVSLLFSYVVPSCWGELKEKAPMYACESNREGRGIEHELTLNTKRKLFGEGKKIASSPLSCCLIIRDTSSKILGSHMLWIPFRVKFRITALSTLEKK